MKRMIAVTVAVLASLFLAIPAQAYTPTVDDVATAAATMGIPAPDVWYLPDIPLNAGFTPGFCDLYGMVCIESPTIGIMGDWSQLSYEAAMMVVYHELQHYVQYLTHTPFDEWEADRVAAETLCRLGGNAVAADLEWILQVLAVYPRATWSSGDDRHGTLMQRHEQIRNLAACDRRQAP